MSTLIGINIKDSAFWLPRFLCQLERLQGDVKRIIFMYGESRDATYSILSHYKRSTRHNIQVYAEPYLPPEERLGAATLARVERDVQALLKEGDEEYYLKLDADLVELPTDLIPRLIEDNVDVIAPYVWTEGREKPTFFDVYGFRKDGCRFHPLKPPIRDGKMAVDTVGTCFLAKRSAALAGSYANPYPLIQFCLSLRERGFQVYADSRVNVTHIDLERLGIRHYPMQIPLSYANYITSENVQLSPDTLMVEAYYTAKDAYEQWTREHKASDAEWVRKLSDSRPLITASYKVLNEAAFLEHSLDSVYPYVDRIDIVEGAIKEALNQADEDGSSVDETVDLIMTYPDPEDKIRLVQGKWRSREHMQAKLLELCESKWMLFIDGDEILDGGEALRRFCADNQSGTVVHAKPSRFLNFWHDFGHVAYSLNPLSPWAKNGIPHAFLIWRDIQGLHFDASHTIAMDAYGVSVSTTYLTTDVYENRWRTLDDVRVFHFGNAKGLESMRNKLRLSHPRMMGDASEDPWLSGEMPPDMVLEEYEGAFPAGLEDHPWRGKRRIRVVESKPTFKFDLVEGAYS